MNTITLHYDIKELLKTQKALSKRNSALNFKDGIYFKNGRNIYYFAKGTIIPKLLITLDSTIYQQSIFQAMPIFCFFHICVGSDDTNFLNMQIEPLYADIQQDSPYILQVANILRNDNTTIQDIIQEAQKQAMQKQSLDFLESIDLHKIIGLINLHTLINLHARHEQRDCIVTLIRQIHGSMKERIQEKENTESKEYTESHDKKKQEIRNIKKHKTINKITSKAINKGKQKFYRYKTRKGKRVRASFHFYKHKESKAKQWFFRESHTDSLLSQDEIQNLTNLTIKQESCMQSTTQKNQERDTYTLINTILQESNRIFDDLFSMDSYIQEQLALRKSA